MKRRILSLFGIFTAAVLVFTALPLSYVYAAENTVGISSSFKGAKVTNTLTFGNKKIKASKKKKGGASINNKGTVATVNITKGGTYVLKGTGTSCRVNINKKNKSIKKITLILKDFSISNQAINDDSPIIYIGKNTKAVEVKLSGSNTLTGPVGYNTKNAKALIYDASTGYIRFSKNTGEDSASLTLTDSIAADHEYGTNAPMAGIYAAGKVAIKNGTFTFTTNGPAIQGQKTGVAIGGGDVTITSNLAQGIVSGSSDISISGGDVKVTKTATDGFYAPKGTTKISGGTVTLSGIGGDGIQSEFVDISGGTTSITTAYEYGATDFYDEGMGAGLFNTRSSNTARRITTTTEYVNYNTGSHCAILAGTEGCTYSIKGSGSGTQKASGGLTISGGKVTVDTLASGTICNNLASGTQVAAEKDLYIIGSPSAGLKSYNYMNITGGVHTIAAGDAGLSAEGTMSISKDSDITVTQSYAGLESPNIIIGTQDQVNDTTQVKLYTSGDSIHGYSATKNYAYEDTTFKKYKKITSTINTNQVTVYSGYVNAVIENEKTVTGKGAGVLTGTNASSTSSGSGGNVTFNPKGNGINCDGNIELLGGSTVLYTAGTGTIAPINYTGKFHIGNGATLLAMGVAGGKNSVPSVAGQPYIAGAIPSATTSTSSTSTSSTSSTAKPTATLKSGDIIGVLNNSGTTMIGIKLPKEASSILFSNPKMKSSSYEIHKGGELSGAINTYKYDGRYQTYTHKTSGTSSSSSSSTSTSTGTGGTTTTQTGPTPLVTLSGKTK